MLLLSLALAEEPTSAFPFAEATALSATYKVSFDLPSAGDQACSMTGFCDCTTQYAADGAKVAETSDSVTFKGTWTVASSDCHAAFKTLFWTGDDGAAFHTLRVDTAGKITEWVIHGEQGNSARVLEGTKAAGQYWVDALDLKWKTGKEASVTQESQADLGEGFGMSIVLKNTHEISLTVN